MNTLEEIQAGIDQYEQHLLQMASVFNAHAAEKGLPVILDPTNVIASVRTGVLLASVASFWQREDDNGIVHESQIKTVIDCIHLLHTETARCGHVVGAMQSGKTTTSLALQWAGPVLYLLEGKPAYPFYIIGSQMNHEDQTRRELKQFLAYYGGLEIKMVQGATASSTPLNPMFSSAPTLNTYRMHVLRQAFNDILDVPNLDDDLVYRRVGGEQSVKKIADLCRRATTEGYRPLMIIDEPQYGASDRLVTSDAGTTQQRECVLTQILNRIEGELGSTRNDHWFIGLSATPFELNDLSRLWEVRQALTSAYSGFNYFNGRPISEDVDIKPPVTMSLSKFADWVKVPFMARIHMPAYDLSKPAAFVTYAKKEAYSGDQSDYRAAIEDALRASIYALLKKYEGQEETVGLCIRAFNDNTKTENLINALALDPAVVEVVRYYGNVSGVSVKRAISQRKTRNLPYVMFVTNRARMADAFPSEVRFFMDFAQKASDLNSLLQGLLGRACGYNKESTVVLSDANAAIVDAYIMTKGAYVHRTSRHSIPVGGYRRGAPTGMLKVRVEMDDPVVQNFFAQIDAKVVSTNTEAGSVKLKAGRAKSGVKFRTGPILRIAEDLNLFDHIESPEVLAKLFPQIPSGFHVARRTDAVLHSQQLGTPLKYAVDENGDCRYTFRWSDRDSAARGGAPGRAKGKRDTQQHMEPTLYVEKFDPATGKTIEDKENPSHPGNWRCFMVTFPLREPIRELQAAEIALPIGRSAYDPWLTGEERAIRDQAEMQA
jgi:hypothetical protein